MHWGTQTTLFGINCFLSRTGYTGEDGFELYVAKEKTKTLWEAILNDGGPEGLLPIGLGARDTLRIEMGYPLHGQELSTTITPMEAGLGWAVKTAKSQSFPGQSILRAQKENGTSRKLCAFLVEDRRQARTGADIYQNQRKVGVVSSGTFSPHLKKPIAMAFVETQALAQTEGWQAKVRDSFIDLTKTQLPFVPSNVKRVKKG